MNENWTHRNALRLLEAMNEADPGSGHFDSLLIDIEELCYCRRFDVYAKAERDRQETLRELRLTVRTCAKWAVDADDNGKSDWFWVRQAEKARCKIDELEAKDE